MGARINWDAARARLASVETTLPPDELSEEQREAILARRAAALAVPPPAEAPADTFEALVFSLGEERYAFPSEQVREVRKLDLVTALPGAPPSLAGLMNSRGRVIAAIDLRPLFGLRMPAGAAQTAILLSTPLGDIAILATDRPAVRRLREAQIGAPPAGSPPAFDSAFVRGVTPDLITVLDAERLVADQRLIVHDEAL